MQITTGIMQREISIFAYFSLRSDTGSYCLYFENLAAKTRHNRGSARPLMAKSMIRALFSSSALQDSFRHKDSSSHLTLLEKRIAIVPCHFYAFKRKHRELQPRSLLDPSLSSSVTEAQRIYHHMRSLHNTLHSHIVDNSIPISSYGQLR
jgi:hypothetical protein